MNILVTGANGFIGSNLCKTLESANFNVRALVRRAQPPVTGHQVVLDLVECLRADTVKQITTDINAIVHTIGLTHEKARDVTSGRSQYRAVNVETSLRLADAAVDNNVRLFVYLSSVKAVGESTPKTTDDRLVPFSDSTDPHPQGEYGRSKYEAEQLLTERLKGTKTRLVILRPPLVYGTGQKGNMRKLFDLVHRRVPLPVAGIQNARSIISVENLCDAILTVLIRPRDSDKPYFITDSTLSTEELVEGIAEALDMSTRLFPCPIHVLKLMAAIIGKANDIDKIIGSLVLDDQRFRADYNWKPRVQLGQALREIAVREYLVK